MLPQLQIAVTLLSLIVNHPAMAAEYQPALPVVREVIVNPLSTTSVAAYIKLKAREKGVDENLALSIARCESGLRQNENGEVLKGKVNPQDIGIYQINEQYHLESSKRLGIDIYTAKGNIDYSFKLIESEGVKPWKASEECWLNNGPK